MNITEKFERIEMLKSKIDELFSSHNYCFSGNN